MTSDLTRIEDWATGLLTQLKPAARRTLAKELASEMRRRQQRRIAMATNPDGTAYAPRKPQLRRKKGRIRRTMFAKLRTARFLKTQSNPERSVVHFANQVERIARVHHFGLRDRVRRNGPVVGYATRELLGLANHDVNAISDLILAHLAK